MSGNSTSPLDRPDRTARTDRADDGGRARAWVRRRTDERGVSEILGAILLFGLIVAILVLLQANAVPSQNERIEFDHNQRVQGDMLELEATSEAVAASGRDRSALIELAPQYPNRFLLLNPGRAQGSLTTRERSFTIENATAVGEPETADYWDGSARSFESRAVSYTPSYNVYQNAPQTTLTHGVVVDRFPNGNVTRIDSTSFVDGRTISLVALDGQRSVATAGTLSVGVVPLATETETVQVNSTAASPLTVRLETDLTVAQWGQLLADETGPQGRIAEIRSGGANTVVVEFEPGLYRLRLAEVGVGSGLTRPEVAYLTTEEDTTRTTRVGEERRVTVQVRDGYNAPNASVPVTFAAENGNVGQSTVLPDEDGTASVTFSANGDGIGRVTATLPGGTGMAGDPRTVVYQFDVRTQGNDTQGTPGDLNPGGTDAFQLESATTQSCTEPNVNTRSVAQYDANCEVQTTFENLGRNRTITEVRVGVFDADQSFGIPRGQGNPQGGPNLDPRERPTEYTFESTGPQPVGGNRVRLATGGGNISVEPGDTSQFTFTFSRNNQRYNVIEGDLFVFTVEFVDGSTSSYLIAPQD